MISTRHGTRRLVTVIIALGLLFTLSTPQRAAAQPPVLIDGAYAGPTVSVGEVVTFSIQYSWGLPIQAVIEAEMRFPATVTVVDATMDCTSTSLLFNANIVNFGGRTSPVGPCTVIISVTFAEAGVYTGSDHSFSAVAEETSSIGTLTVTQNSFNANITVESGTPAPEESGSTGTPTPAVCDLPPDMAVSPELIDLAPGGTAVIELAMRNLCPDAPTPSGDLLLSLSNGLSVVDHSAGMINLGQRVAVQNFTLLPDETRRWTVTVAAAQQLVAAPQHITEYYTGGRVLSRIDGVFITPAPVAEPAVVAESTAPAAEAPIPAVLPNTAGEQSTLPTAVLWLTLAAAVAAFAVSRRSAAH